MHISLKRSSICICIMVLLTACSRRVPNASFYYWRTVFDLSKLEQQTLQDLKVTKLYVRYFDVTLSTDGKPQPVSPIRFAQKPKGVEVIPVVYIKNAVMIQDGLQVTQLANHIYDYINQINKSAHITGLKEIQIDCDWTLESRNRFMQFIDTLKHTTGKRLSATIRLHQVKYYKKTGIPNVDRGVLMYYNMGRIAPDTLNSIYDRKTASRYIKRLEEYPLELDIALPLFAWGVHVRNNKVVNIISKCDKTTFENDTNYYVQPHSNIIKVKHSNIKQNRYYLKNDWIKIEDVSAYDLRQMYKDIRKHIRRQPNEIIYYDLDEINIKRYDNEIRFF